MTTSTGVLVSPGRQATLADAQHAYVVFLGRVPDSRERMQELAANSVAGIISDMAGSDEFASVIRHIVETGVTPARTRLKERDIRGASAWAADITRATDLSTAAEWDEMILAVLTSTSLAPLVGHHPDFDAAIERMSAHKAQANEVEAALTTELTFDPDWFSRTSAGARLGQDADFAAALPSRTDLPATLAWFTERLDDLKRIDRPKTLGALVRATRKAALHGDLGHWLFNPAFYLQQAAASESLSGFGDDQTIDPYLAFLAHGDAADVAPHPLFSPFAYRTLNPDAAIGPAGCFHHFVTEGVAAGLRTSALFDEDFYLSRQPQVRLALAAGDYSCALEHFIRVGMAAGFSFSPDFDRDHYLCANPDLRIGLEAGDLPSAEWHFVESGAREGRSPNPFFDAAYYMERYPHIRNEMDQHGIGSPLEHFLLLGRQRGWRVNRPPVSLDVDMVQAKALFEKRGRRAYSEALAGVFSFDETPSDPALSVIVPISGQADFTAGFLKSARWAMDHLELKRGVTTEIIVVDNGSRDHTARLLEALPGVRCVSFDRPIGFPAAVNAGVAASTGRIVLVANNDIAFEADAFLRLFDTLDQNPHYGVVGAKIVLPNETLQEVGSALDRNGGPIGFGRGMDALDCRGVRTVEVDYASACFVGFARADFDALSGFDEAYSPGYYEEVDFSLRMKRDLGKPTVVDTGLAITHYEHASFSKGRPHTVNEPLVLRNRARLRRDHTALFVSLQTRSPEAALDKAREALAGRARVLMVTDTTPSSLMGSASRREEDILAVLARRDISCDVVALNPSPGVDDLNDPLVRLYRGWMPGQSLTDVLQAARDRYSHLWLGGALDLGQAAEMIEVARRLHGLKVICDTGTLSSLRLAERRASQGDAPSTDEVRDLAMVELTLPVAVDLWIATGRQEQDLIETLGMGPVLEIGAAVVAPGGAEFGNGFADRSGLLFTGFADSVSSPDHDALVWFLTEIYPRLDTASRPPLTVAGYWEEGCRTTILERFAPLAIDFVGRVADAELARLFARKRLAIAPTRFEAGVPTSAIHAIVSGLPVVVTDRLAGLLDLQGEHLAAAQRFDHGAAFAGWIETLLSDPKAWVAQRALQRKAVGDRWSADRLEGQIVAALDALGLASEPGTATELPSASEAKTPRRTSRKRSAPAT